MGKFIIAGITQIETIIKVDRIPIAYHPFTGKPDTIYTAAGGDAYNCSLALEWLGDKVKFMTVVSETQNLGIFNPPGREVTLSTEYVLPVMKETPMEVLLFDRDRKQQKFEDLKDIRVAQFDMTLVTPVIDGCDAIVLSNANFCRPFIQLAKDNGKLLAVKIHNYDPDKEVYNEDFLRNADILYFSDNTVDIDAQDFVNEMKEKYDPEIIIMGIGERGVILYDKKRNINARHKPVGTKQVENTAGAGNALFACFLHYYLKTQDPSLSIRKALLFSANKIGYIGTSNGFMTEEQLETWEKLIFDPGDTERWNR